MGVGVDRLDPAAGPAGVAGRRLRRLRPDGRQAARLLLAKVAGQAGGMHLVLDVELIVRASA